MTRGGFKRWVSEQPRRVRMAIVITGMVLVNAAFLGVFVLLGIATGHGPWGALPLGLVAVAASTVNFLYRSHRDRTAPLREQRQQVEHERTRVAYEAAHRGDGGQEIT